MFLYLIQEVIIKFHVLISLNYHNIYSFHLLIIQTSLDLLLLLRHHSLKNNTISFQQYHGINESLFDI